MPRPKDTGKKSMGTSRASNRKGNASDVQKAISANTKKYKAMTPAQKKAYNVKQVKSVVKGAAQVASMVGGAGLARKGGVAATRKLVPAKKVKVTQDLAKMKNALINNVNSKNLKGKIGKTPASQPSRPLDRNIARGYELRKKFPDKFKP
jgi:hypothetical protein